MALMNSQDKLIQDFSEVFEVLEKMVDSSLPASESGKKVCQIGGPPVALNSQPSSSFKEQPKGIIQMFEEVKGLKDSEYSQLALQYLPMIIGVGKSLLPYLNKGSPELLSMVWNVGIIGIGLAGFAELVVLKQIIENDCSHSGAEARELLNDTLEYTKTKIQNNQLRFDEIEHLILKAKLEDPNCSSKKRSPLLITLEEEIRLCQIDISECMQKTKELYVKIESTIAAFSKKLVKSTVAAGVLGTLAVVGAVAATAATGGLAVVAGVAAGVTGAATGGFSYHAKLCGDSKHDFLVMKSRCDSLFNDVKRMERRLKLHIKELRDKKINVGTSFDDFV